MHVSHHSTRDAIYLSHDWVSEAVVRVPQEHAEPFLVSGVGMLDVQQIFGRAGRPQFEDEGLGIIITQHAQLAHYLGMLTHQTPIESKFTDPLVDNLNAEIVLGNTQNPIKLCNGQAQCRNSLR